MRKKKRINIKNLFESSNIEKLKALFLIFKATDSRSTDRLNIVMNEIFSLLGKKIKNNIIVIFTFCDCFKDIKGINLLKDRNRLFYEILGDIE